MERLSSKADPAAIRHSSVDEWIVELHAEVRGLADRMLSDERAGHTLQPTALVNEAYLRLSKQRNLNSADRTRFLAAAAKTIRRVLIDYARQRKAKIRGGDRIRVTMDSCQFPRAGRQYDLLVIDDLFKKLATLNKRVGHVAVLRFYSGMTDEETAQVLGVSTRTVSADWAFGKTWLKRELAD